MFRAIQYVERPWPKLQSGLRIATKTKLRNGSGYLPVQRLKINAAFVPPKPKEFDSA